MKLSYASVELAVRERLAAAGVPDRAAGIVAGHLLCNERLGKVSHGLLRLPGIVRAAETSRMGQDCELVTADGRSPVVEGQGLPGIYAMTFGVRAMLDGALPTAGITAVGLRGYTGATGNLGLYVWTAARAGLVLLAACNSEAAIAAPGAANPLTGTNPIAFGFPSTDGHPVVGDYSSSVLSYGDIAVAGQRGQRLPAGVVLDAEGRPSTEPSDADVGSILASGGHRGFCQSVLVELLCGTLVGGKVGAEADPGNAAMFIALAPSIFGQAGTVTARVNAFKQQIAKSRRIPGQPPPRSPGTRYAQLLEMPPVSIEILDSIAGRLRDVGIRL